MPIAQSRWFRHSKNSNPKLLEGNGRKATVVNISDALLELLTTPGECTRHIDDAITPKAC
jgi:hypothetical protein